MAKNDFDHNLGVTEGMQQEAAVREQFRKEWPALCKMLGISPHVLGRVEPQVVVAVMLCRMHIAYTTKLKQHELQIAVLRGALAAQAAAPPEPEETTQ